MAKDFKKVQSGIIVKKSNDKINVEISGISKGEKTINYVNGLDKGVGRFGTGALIIAGLMLFLGKPSQMHNTLDFVIKNKEAVIASVTIFAIAIGLLSGKKANKKQEDIVCDIYNTDDKVERRNLRKAVGGKTFMKIMNIVEKVKKEEQEKAKIQEKSV